MGEFDIIARYFAPLSSAETGAFDLKDDAATINVSAGEQVVVTSDCLIADVHFFSNDPADLIARKALAVNLSDLAAMGARPEAYTLACAWPTNIGNDWLESFAGGLKKAQEQWQVTLIGGDTVATDGPLTLTITAIGKIAEGTAIRRSGANVEDDIYVTGTIGDAALGLHLLQNSLDTEISAPEQNHLIQRYRAPEPRITIGKNLIGIATSAMDVSDGLIADLTHIAEQSGVSAELLGSRIPISKAAEKVVEKSPDLLETLLNGGDDYELLFTAPGSRQKKIEALIETHSIPITRIGTITHKRGAQRVRVIDAIGKDMEFNRTSGYRHF